MAESFRRHRVCGLTLLLAGALAAQQGPPATDFQAEVLKAALAPAAPAAVTVHPGRSMTDPIDGLFRISNDALNKKIDYADQSIERYERSIESYQLTLERRFTAMEQMVSQLQAQGNYLTSVMYSQ